MYAISGLGTVREPLLDRSREDEAQGHGVSRKNSLSGDLNDVFPPARWTHAVCDGKKRQFPQTIAHRGYKASYPENTMSAFRAAVEVGTHALETDIHLSKDHVVVLSHDKDLKRCFGRDERILDCDWKFLQEQRTIKEPHESMPRLADLLHYLAQPEQQHIWVLLDIKVDNDANDVIRLIAETIKSTGSGPRKWNQRVVLGIWAARYLPLCAQYLPGFPISYIGFSTFYARQFLRVPNISFNMLQKVLHGPIGARFIRDVKRAKRPLYVWTVNEVDLMKWSIQKEVDGVITDDPRLFKQVCDDWDDNEPPVSISWSQVFHTLWLYVLLIVFWIPIKRRFPESVDTYLQAKKVHSRVARETQ